MRNREEQNDGGTESYSASRASRSTCILTPCRRASTHSEQETTERTEKAMWQRYVCRNMRDYGGKEFKAQTRGTCRHGCRRSRGAHYEETGTSDSQL